MADNALSGAKAATSPIVRSGHKEKVLSFTEKQQSSSADVNSQLTAHSVVNTANEHSLTV